MVGSSFNSPAESNYAPIEGECLGVVNALHKTKYYTQGCDKLIVGTDHKPLLGVLNNRSLESIDNPRLVRLKEKTLGWRFRIIHIPGRKLVGPDALSRAVAPSPEEMQMLVYCHEMSEQYTPVPGTKFPGWGVIEQQGDEMSTKEAREGILGAIRTVMGGQYTLPDPEMDASECMLASMELGIKSVSWEMVKAELSKDAEFKDLADWIEGGCRGLPEDLPLHLKQYWRVKSK